MKKKFNIDSMSKVKIKKTTKLFKNNSIEFFSGQSSLSKALAQALVDGDREAFFEIIQGYLGVVNKEELSRRSNVPIATIRRMARGENFNIDNLLKITSALKAA